jgi:hypothetical protein
MATSSNITTTVSNVKLAETNNTLMTEINNSLDFDLTRLEVNDDNYDYIIGKMKLLFNDGRIITNLQEIHSNCNTIDTGSLSSVRKAELDIIIDKVKLRITVSSVLQSNFPTSEPIEFSTLYKDLYTDFRSSIVKLLTIIKDFYHSLGNDLKLLHNRRKTQASKKNRKKKKKKKVSKIKEVTRTNKAVKKAVTRAKKDTRAKKKNRA